MTELIEAIAELKEALDELGDPVGSLERLAETAGEATIAINELKEALEGLGDPVGWLAKVAETAQEATIAITGLTEETKDK